MKKNPLLLWTSIFLVLLSLAMLITPRYWWSMYLVPPVVAAATLASVTALWLTNLFRRKQSINPALRARQEQSLLGLQNYFLLAFLLGVFGTVNDVPVEWQFDKITHFLTSFLGVIGIAFFARDWYHVPLSRAVAFAFIVTVGAELIWEVLEFGSDRLLGTYAFGQYGANAAADTASDVICNTLGSFAAGWLILRKDLTLKTSGNPYGKIRQKITGKSA